jgi:hypothetical protein
MQRDEADPKGLVREAYRIEGITDAECRSIFVDWALSLPPGADAAPALATLLDRHGAAAPAHPMTALLRAARDGAPLPRRRGGAMGRRR